MHSVTRLLNLWLIQLMALHSFIYLWSPAGTWPQCQYSGHLAPSVFRSALPHLRSLFQRQCQLMGDRWEARSVFSHRRFSPRALGWVMDHFNCSAKPNGPCGEENGSIVHCNDFMVLPTPVFFSPPLKGHELQIRLEGSLCLDEKQHLICSPHPFLAWAKTNQRSDLPRPQSPPGRATRVTSKHLHRPWLSKCSFPPDPSLLHGSTALYKLGDVALIMKVGEIPPKRVISSKFWFL